MGKYVTASLAVGQDGHQVWRLVTKSNPQVWGRRGPNNLSLKAINMTKSVSQSLLHVGSYEHGNETLGCIILAEFEQARKY